MIIFLFISIFIAETACFALAPARDTKLGEAWGLATSQTVLANMSFWFVSTVGVQAQPEEQAVAILDGSGGYLFEKANGDGRLSPTARLLWGHEITAVKPYTQAIAPYGPEDRKKMGWAYSHTDGRTTYDVCSVLDTMPEKMILETKAGNNNCQLHALLGTWQKRSDNDVWQVMIAEDDARGLRQELQALLRSYGSIDRLPEDVQIKIKHHLSNLYANEWEVTIPKAVSDSIIADTIYDPLTMQLGKIMSLKGNKENENLLAQCKQDLLKVSETWAVYVDKILPHEDYVLATFELELLASLLSRPIAMQIQGVPDLVTYEPIASLQSYPRSAWMETFMAKLPADLPIIFHKGDRGKHYYQTAPRVLSAKVRLPDGHSVTVKIEGDSYGHLRRWVREMYGVTDQDFRIRSGKRQLIINSNNYIQQVFGQTVLDTCDMSVEFVQRNSTNIANAQLRWQA